MKPITWRCLLLLVFGAPFLPASLCAQAEIAKLRVRVESAAGVPLGGALVELLDAADRVVTAGISGESGWRVLRAAAGTYKVRVRRIGFRPFLSGRVSLPHAADLVLSVETPRIVLNTILVTSGSQCRRFDTAGQALGTVWDEISKALRSSELTIDDLKGTARARVYRKQVAAGGAVLSSDTTFLTVIDRKPFGARDPSMLASDGYVQGSPLKGWTYFGPDETVLLSDEFAATHCFRLVRDRERIGQIGVAFEPIPRRRVPDIVGVLWVDESSSELRELVFRFVNVDMLERFRAGGSSKFRRMPSGAWIVSEWQLKGPRLEIRPGHRESVVAVGYVEDGGGIEAGSLRVEKRGGTGTLTGVVYDSLENVPLRGAIVSLGKTVAWADGEGKFAFTRVSVGMQTISFSHPALSAYGILALERDVQVAGDTTRILLATPSFQTAWMQICTDSVATPFERNRGILHGVVRDQSGQSVGNARVRVTWTEYAPSVGTADLVPRMSLEVSSDRGGRYSVCGFRRMSRGLATVVGESVSSAPRAFDFGKSLVVRRDISLLAKE